MEALFDWVGYQGTCPQCGAGLDKFRTKDACNQLDTVDYRTVNHFYAACACGAWIDFVRKSARDIQDFEMRVEKD